MVSTPAEVDRLLSAADESTARVGLGPETRAAVVRAVAAARELGDPGRLLHALGRAALNLALERLADGGDVTEVWEKAEEVLVLAGGLLADPELQADAVYRTAQAGQILAATGDAERGRDIVERLWRSVAPRPADDLDALRARTAALTALVTMRLDTDPAGLGPLAAEMVDLQRRLAREDGIPASVVDLSEALGIFVRVARTLGRPDLMRVALTEQYSLAQNFEGSRAQEQRDRIMAALSELHQAAPDIPIVVPGSGAWRMRGSYLDLLFEPGPSGSASGSFAARLAAESRLTGPASGGRLPADPSVIRGCAARLDHGIALAGAERLAEADQVFAELADELSLHDGVMPEPARGDVRRLWAAALYERAMLRHGLGHSDDAWNLAWLSIVVSVRRHEGPAPEGPTPENPTPENPTPQEAAPEETAPENPTPQEATPQEATPQEATPQETAPEETAPKNPTSQKPAPERTAPENPAPERTAFRRTTPGTAAHREALADTATHMVDAATIAVAAGRPEDQIMLLSEAIRRCANQTDPRLRRILGKALHNLAAALRQHPDAATALSERAREVRRELADPADPGSLREYANTLLLTAALAVDRQDWQVAVERLAAVLPLALAVGAAGEAMAAHARQLATAVAARAPELVDRFHHEGHWPYPTR
ncbi:hypothetical protein Ait01nite_056950 [Actinoplanes italicus]|uniref:Uncharacterized protein n=1 Tax=Actinoplanes italicus TaxID=113567 RepID=A0A2T0K628_9ACTN|nr:hypothetical protein [Actinoplanes italicus]PRX18246.1 hypothetical protein CLV67_11379 [Actinoplanes italicus]GIE32650.1 hypothetical protein Ait01nite_056950 [Actinoplanes italicus]